MKKATRPEEQSRPRKADSGTDLIAALDPSRAIHDAPEGLQ